LSVDGRLLSRYRHREAVSSGEAVAVDSGGSVYVTGHLRGTVEHSVEGWPRRTILLAFDP
jgi:hypothetical protein